MLHPEEQRAEEAWSISYSSFSFFVKNYQKQHGEERICFILKLSGHSPSLTEAGAGTEGEATEDCCLATYSPCIAPFTFLNTPGPLAKGQ